MMKGTEKQIKWAEDIKEKQVYSLERLFESKQLIDNFKSTYNVRAETIINAINSIKNEESSEKIIEHRYLNGIDLIRRYYIQRLDAKIFNKLMSSYVVLNIIETQTVNEDLLKDKIREFVDHVQEDFYNENIIEECKKILLK